MYPPVPPRWKRAAVLLLAVLLCAGLCGCLEHPLHHTRWEVLSYLKENFPGEKIKVSWRHYEEPDMQYGSSVDWVDWVWDCYFSDSPEIVFHVRSSWWTGGPVPVAGYRLYNDADMVFYRHYLDQYLAEVGSLDAWEIEDYQLEMDFASMEQVYPAAEQLQAFYGWLGEQPHVGYTRSARCNLTGLPLPDWILRDWVYIGRDTGEEAVQASVYDTMVVCCAEMLMGYYGFYGLPCPGCTPEEVQAYAQDEWPWDEGYPYPDAMRYNGESLPRSTFAGVGIDVYYVSFAGFYEMLSRLEFAVEGTPEHFSFTGLDGCLYEFSYDFQEEADGETKWYFTCDGEKATSGHISYTNSAPLLYLKDERLPDMVGLWVKYYD